MSEKGSVPRYIGGGAPLHVVRSPVSGGVMFAVEGELDRETTPRLATALRKAIDEAPDRVELDLAKVTFMDSQGLRILLEAKRRAGDETEVVVTQTSGQVERLLHATGVADILGVSPRR